MEIFSLDLGNKQTKLMSSKTKVVLPSSFFYESDMPLSFGIDTSEDLHTYSVPFSDDKFIWGKDIGSLHLDEYMIDTIMYGNRYEDQSFKLLANFALGLLACDFKEAQKQVLKVVVAVGLPTEDYADENKLRSLIEMLKGQHQITIDKQILTVRVEHVYVLPQPIGTLYNELLDDEAYIKDDGLLNKKVGVIDVGGGTILIDTVLNFQLSSRNRHQFNTGANSLYEVIAGQINGDVSLHQLADDLRAGMKNKQWSYRFSDNRTDDITGIVTKEITRFTKKIIANIKTTLKNLESIDMLLLTGGGANLLNQKILTEAFDKVKVVVVSETETANVTGFYKFALDQENKVKEEDNKR
ncbi:ParM/StbA family protein [Lactobacillus sp. ESL0679]|uniref:ParM/StbA family protein n=1 Tax=Lactobacillus sp. ESL0679 TaxID=2983209 RepID=UPI0023F890DE|nr:ParM/StbA family protein [Lactobacillus sp. ESL0679]